LVQAIAVMSARADILSLCDAVERFRSRRPHVHCITNAVAQHFTANVLLAAGGTPSMTISRDEIASFAQFADALLVNLGTLDDERLAAADIAIATVQQSAKPFVLDPVFVQASPPRLAKAQMLLARKPDVVRANEPELTALLGCEPDEAAVTQACRDFATTFAMTGPVDRIVDAAGSIAMANGSRLMSRITAMGCALTALIAGFCVVEPNRRQASAAAILLFNVAGEIAEERSSGPGTFVPYFLDALATLEPFTLEQKARLT
jgi:hydroxyethylthiazole kinase